ncbi:beta-ketoacyl-[acyl-carrier-protein] synthase family protein [Enterobacter sp. WCHEn045836]|uniref:beta-ketoacyl-[acyl-carrier-protein] synthase family protein n=1 Tax=Enterobacter sp. WCHEn045836 TaxID=2497434 RepID=UPI000F81E389|nr:beta-ketoacyl-[acyl-carrier-protein] synthase family protein [Enterobacter sp. WCHEn045836]RTP97299.1 beta-ketoacyl-[acyl-carrier-protein] synthase family protein [Enterobacter sp. WCHEn045836]
MNNSVVITGLGMVTPLGCGSDTVWERLNAGKSGITGLTFHDASEGVISYPAGIVSDKTADPTAGFEPADFFTEKSLQRTNRFIQFAVAAAEEAIQQAGWLQLTAEQKERTGVVIGSSQGGIQSLLDAASELSLYGRKSTSPFTSPLSLLSIAAGAVSIRFGFMGPSFAPSTACAASLQGIGEALSILHNNDADVVIAGGSEATLNPVSFAGFQAAGALSRNISLPFRKRSRPFDRDRDGFILSEGAAIMVLEKREHALNRGVVPLAEIGGYGTSSDSFHITSGLRDGKGVAKAMRNALRSASITPDAVGYLSAHATSTPIGDLCEYLAIREVFGSTSHLSVSAIKSAFGHLQGAAGALATAVTIQALRAGKLPATHNTRNFSDEMPGLDIIIGSQRVKSVDYAMVNAFGFGGINTSLVLKAC